MVTRDLYYSLLSCSSVFFHAYFLTTFFPQRVRCSFVDCPEFFHSSALGDIFFCSHFDWFGSVWRKFFSTLMNLVRNIFVRLLLWTTRMLIHIVIVPFFPIVLCLLLQCIRVLNAFHGYSLDGSENQYIHNINHLFRRVYTFNMNMHCRWMDGTSEIRTNA